MKLSPEIVQQIIELKNYGYSSRKIAAILNIGKTTVNDNLSKIAKETPALNQIQKSKPRVLLFDLESTPSIVAAFGRWKVNIGTESVIREGGYLLSACWKYLGDEEVTKVVLTSEEAFLGNDSRIVCALFEAFENADIVIAHNAKKFDVPLFNTRLLANGMPPAKPVKVVDTLQIAKKNLKFNSNKLDSLGHYLGVGRKIETTGMSLWLRCMDGDEEALQDMLTYNEQDVILLEKVYLALRAFDPSPANMGHYFNDYEHHCPACGSTDVDESGNSVYTPVSQFAEVVCNSCGHRSRKRIALNSKEKRSKLLVTAR